MEKFLEALADLWASSGLAQICNFENGGWKNLIMIAIAGVLLYLAIRKQFEPLLLLPIAFGMLLVNLPLGGVMDPQKNSLVPFSAEETTAYVEGTYEQVYPVYLNEVSVDGSDTHIVTYKKGDGSEVLVYNTGNGIYPVTKNADGTATVSVPFWQHFVVSLSGR